MSKPKLSTPVRILLGVVLSTLDGLAGAGGDDLLWSGGEAIGEESRTSLWLIKNNVGTV